MPKTREWFRITMKRFRERSTTTPVGNSYYTTVGATCADYHSDVGSGRSEDGAALGVVGAIACLGIELTTDFHYKGNLQQCSRRIAQLLG